MTRVAILRCAKLPSFVTWEIPNFDELFEEDHLLLRGFEQAGFHARPVVWSDPGVDWSRFDIALIRSAWDYLDERDRFLQVLSKIEGSSCRLFNPLDAIQWNIDKQYLFDLEQWGVPIIPTRQAAELEFSDSKNLFPGIHTDTFILKPTIGLGGSHSYRVSAQEVQDTLTSRKMVQPDQEYLIQPFIEDILTEGEWSFIYFDRQLSHVLLKKPAAHDYRVQGIYGGSIQPAQPSPEDVQQAQEVLEKLPFDILYARLDFVRVKGRLSIIEVELIEPIFSFNLVPESIARLVNATRLQFARPRQV